MPQTQATMTEQEAQAWVTRLKRIWKAKNGHLRIQTQKIFWFETIVDGRTNIEFATLAASFPAGELQLQLRYGQAMLTWKQGQISSFGKDMEQPDFATRWLDLFRRGCWLSGCPIEASAHEKAEWIQGFSQEELQAWNLKM